MALSFITTDKSKGVGNSTVIVSCSENPNRIERTHTLKIKTIEGISKEVLIKQKPLPTLSLNFDFGAPDLSNILNFKIYLSEADGKEILVIPAKMYAIGTATDYNSTYRQLSINPSLSEIKDTVVSLSTLKEKDVYIYASNQQGAPKKIGKLKLTAVNASLHLNAIITQSEDIELEAQADNVVTNIHFRITGYFPITVRGVNSSFDSGNLESVLVLQSSDGADTIEVDAGSALENFTGNGSYSMEFDTETDVRNQPDNGGWNKIIGIKFYLKDKTITFNCEGEGSDEVYTEVSNTKYYTMMDGFIEGNPLTFDTYIPITSNNITVKFGTESVDGKVLINKIF